MIEREWSILKGRWPLQPRSHLNNLKTVQQSERKRAITWPRRCLTPRRMLEDRMGRMTRIDIHKFQLKSCNLLRSLWFLTRSIENTNLITTHPDSQGKWNALGIARASLWLESDLAANPRELGSWWHNNTLLRNLNFRVLTEKGNHSPLSAFFCVSRKEWIRVFFFFNPAYCRPIYVCAPCRKEFSIETVQ